MANETNSGSCLSAADPALQALCALFDVISMPIDISGAGQSAAEIKRLSNLSGAMKEIKTVGGTMGILNAHLIRVVDCCKMALDGAVGQ